MSINVLHIGNLINVGGVEVQLVGLFSNKIDNFNFFVFSRKPMRPCWQEKLKSLNIPFYQCTDRNKKELQLVKFAIENKIDIAHFHILWRKAEYALKKARVKVIIEHDHSFSWQYNNMNRLREILIPKYRSAKKLVDGVISVSNASKIMLTKRLNYNPDKINVIHNGINFDNLISPSPVPKPKDKKVVTTIGRCVNEKGLDLLLYAIPKILKEYKDVEFWFIGDGPLLNNYKEIAGKLKISDYIKFWGEQLVVGNFLVSSDIFVLPSFRESFGIAFVEAGYFELPSVASNIDGIPEIITNGETGILVDATIPIKNHKHKGFVIDGKTKKLIKPLSVNPEDLALAIINLLRNPDLCKNMGKKAREKVIQFSVERFCNQLIEYYKKILQRSGY